MPEAQLYYIVMLPEGAPAPRLPEGSCFASARATGSIDPPAAIVVEPGAGPRFIAETVRDEQLLRRVATAAPDRHVLWASGAAERVFADAPAALRAALEPVEGGWVNDPLRATLFAREPALALAAEPVVEEQVGIEPIGGNWVITRGLAKLGLPELALENEKDELQPTASALLLTIAEEVAKRAEPLAPGERHPIAGMLLEASVPPGVHTAKLASVPAGAHEQHLWGIKPLLRAERPVRPIEDPGVLTLRLLDERGEPSTVSVLQGLLGEIEPGLARAEGEGEWWQRTWSEREELLTGLLGPSHPPDAEPGTVLAFSSELRLAFPGACCYVFRPQPDIGRDRWLYATHGPAQPQTPEDVEEARAAGRKRSGSGWELGVAVREPADWAPQLLGQLLHYSRMADPALDMGHRLGFSLLRGEGGAPQPLLLCGPGDLEPGDVALGSAACIILWPTLDPWRPWTTSTGNFHLLMAVPVTLAEWELAKQASTLHLQMLLFEAGVGQIADPFRPSVTEDAQVMARWHELAATPADDVFNELYTRFAKGPDAAR